MTRGPEIWPTRSPRRRSSRGRGGAPRRCACSPRRSGPCPGADFLSSARSGSRYSGFGVRVDLEERALRVLGRRRRRRTRARGRASGDATRRRGRGSRGRRRPAARGCGGGWNESVGSDAGAGCGSGCGARSRRTRVEATRTACPERRTSAPSEAPVRKSTPAIVEQDAEDRRAGRPEPRATRPTRAAARPSRRGREPSVSISPTTVDAEPEPERPHARRARCASRSARRAGAGRPARRRRPSRSPPRAASGTGPPLSPNQSTQARKTPTASEPEPDQLGVVVAAARFFARRRFSRAGVFGRGLAVRVCGLLAPSGHFAPRRAPSVAMPAWRDASAARASDVAVRAATTGCAPGQARLLSRARRSAR